MNPDEFTKTRRVVISDSLGIAPGFKNWVGLDNLVLQRCFSFLPFSGRTDSGKVGDDLLGVFCLSST